MGYVIVNQLNVMWLDGLVFLPLIILGLEKLLSGESGLSYSFFLGVMLISNYYIGFMICVFLVFYSIFAYSRQEVAGPIGLKTHLRHFFIQSARSSAILCWGLLWLRFADPHFLLAFGQQSKLCQQPDRLEFRL